MIRLVRLLVVLALSSLTAIAGKKTSPTAECVPSSTDLNEFVCYKSSFYKSSCEDTHNECHAWAAKGECKENPSYMEFNCRKSCDTCIDVHYGSAQAAPPKFFDRVKAWLDETKSYYEGTISRVHDCQNKDPLCTYYAVQDMCHNHEKSPFMKENCAMACRTCFI